MNGQAKGMAHGRGLNCRGTGMGRGMARKQGKCGQAMTAGQTHGVGRGRCFDAEELSEADKCRGQGRGRGLGQNCGLSREQRPPGSDVKAEES